LLCESISVVNYLPAALASSAASCRVKGQDPGQTGAVFLSWVPPGLRLLPRHRRSPKKSALGWHS